MRLLIPVFILAPLLGSCAPSATPPSDEDRQTIVEEVTETVGRLRDAMNAQDAEGVLRFYDIGPDFIYVSCTELFLGTRYRSIASLYFRPTRGVTFEQEVIQVKVLAPGVAVVTIRGNSSQAPYLFWTQVWVRDSNRGWIITQAHQSWPGCLDPPSVHPGTAVPDSVDLHEEEQE